MAVSQCTSCMDGEGYAEGEKRRTAAVSQAARIRQAAALAIAIDNALQAVNNYKKQRDIAKRSLAISKAQQKQLQDVYWPRELEFLAEFGTPEAIETVEVMGRRYGGRLLASIAGAFAKALREARCGGSRYCTSANRKMVQDLLLARSTAMANARVLGRNIAFAEFQARTDTNFNRRMQAIAIGRGLMGDAAKLLQNAAGGLASAGNIISRQFNSAIEAFGYARFRSQQHADGLVARDNMARETYTPNGGRSGDPFFDAGLATQNGIGYQSSVETVASQSAGGFGTNFQFGTEDGAGVAQRNMFNDSLPLQNEVMNDMDVGDDDLVRTGTVTFPVASIVGGSVTIDMERFGLRFADDENPKMAT